MISRQKVPISVARTVIGTFVYTRWPSHRIRRCLTSRTLPPGLRGTKLRYDAHSLTALLSAFWQKHSVQCGFSTRGIVLALQTLSWLLDCIGWGSRTVTRTSAKGGKRPSRSDAITAGTSAARYSSRRRRLCDAAQRVRNKVSPSSSRLILVWN